MDFVNLTFTNFMPSLATQEYCALIFMNIVNSAPHDSYVKGTVARALRGKYVTHFEVRSKVGTFLSDARKKSSLESVRAASETLMNSLGEWKRDRYFNELKAVV